MDLYSFSNRGLDSSWLYWWYSSCLRRLVSAVSAGRCIRRDCVDDVGCVDEVDDGYDDVRLADVAAGNTVASGLDDGFASGLSLSSSRRGVWIFSLSGWSTRFEGGIPSCSSLSCLCHSSI